MQPGHIEVTVRAVPGQRSGRAGARALAACADPARTASAVLVELHALHPAELRCAVAHFDRLAGNALVRAQVLAGEPAGRITAGWAAEAAAFAAARAPYLLYP
jgi:uncharacterized protein YbbC (DUF1343 family)